MTRVPTVCGPVDTADLGPTCVHEHLRLRRAADPGDLPAQPT